MVQCSVKKTQYLYGSYKYRLKSVNFLRSRSLWTYVEVSGRSCLASSHWSKQPCQMAKGAAYCVTLCHL